MVRALWRRIGDRGGPSGDDCAFVGVGKSRLAISSDLSIEGTHFRLGWASPQCRRNPIIGLAQETFPTGAIADFDENCTGSVPVIGFTERAPVDFLD